MLPGCFDHNNIGAQKLLAHKTPEMIEHYVKARTVSAQTGDRVKPLR